jgi:hypothetical protein
VKVGKTPYVRFDLNDYSIPHTHVRKCLTVFATLKQVRILDGQNEIAHHCRSYDKAQQIEDPTHIAVLIQQKAKARKHQGQNRLTHAVPPCAQLLSEAALRGDNLGSITSTLLRLLDQYGASELTIAVEEALDKDVPHPNAVRQALQRRCEAQHKPPPIPVALPDDERVKDLTVKPHNLDADDQIKAENQQPGDAQTAAEPPEEEAK